MVKPVLVRSLTATLRMEKVRQETIVARCRPLIALIVWLAVSAVLASVYYAVESGPEEERARRNDELMGHAGLIAAPPPPTAPPSPPPGNPPRVPLTDRGPRPGGGSAPTPGGGSAPAPGGGSVPAPGSGDADSGNNYNGGPGLQLLHHRLPRVANAFAQARTANLTEELIALRSYIAELEKRGKQRPVNSGSLNWTPAGSLFFAFTVMTTIGYGTFVPETDEGRILTMFLGLVGIISTGFMLGTCAASLNTFVERILFSCRTVCSRQVPTNTQAAPKVSMSAKVGFTATLLLVYMLAGALIPAYAEGWAYLDALYFVFVSISTIGFGDYAMISDSVARTVMQMLFLLPGMIIFALFVNLGDEASREASARASGKAASAAERVGRNSRKELKRRRSGGNSISPGTELAAPAPRGAAGQAWSK